MTIMKLIDKDALVAELERRINFHKERGNQHDSSICDVLYGLSHHIDTLEVKEVDDEPGCKIFPRPIECYSNCKECPFLATNNKAQKGE